MPFATSLIVLLAGALAAPGEIYRCAKADGSASYQDRPCNGATPRPQDRLATGDDPRALREWLSQFRHAPPGRRAQAVTEPMPQATPSPRPSQGVAMRQLGEHELAVCSERFYVCADSDGGRMDDCVARMTQCGTGAGSACCPAQTLSCYRDIRTSGSTPAQAVRGALLGSGATCGT